jgi:hypothetical protein
LHPYLLYTNDAGGGDVRFTFSDQASLLLYYVQLEEDLDRYTGSAKIGEDYITGGSLILKPISGLELHLLGVYGHGQEPFGPALTGNGGPFDAVAGDTINIATESRYYLGFDSRYSIGNLRIEPSFIYLLGTRKFSDGTDTKFNAYQAHMVLFYTTGPWLFGGKFGYASGNKADDDINGRGIGNKSDVKGFRPLGVDGGHVFGQWLEILGSSDVDGTGSTQGPTSPGENGIFDRFGQIRVTAKAEYKYTDVLTFEGAAGSVWTTEKSGCPASLRIGSITGPCGGATTSAGTPAFNFTGNSKYVGTEVAAGLRYTIMPGLTWTPRFAWVFMGDAWSTNDRKAQDAWVLINRMIYIF